MNDKVGYWLSLADYDMETAKAMLKTGRYLYVGFMCHQVVEKSLKAVISRDCEEGQIPPKIHDLSKLALRAGLLGKMSVAQQDFAEDLNPLNVEARYPEHKKSIAATLTDKQCRQLIAETEDLQCWIKSQL